MAKSTHQFAYIETDAIKALTEKLGALSDTVKKATEEALYAARDIVTAKAEEAMQPQNLPAGGKYSRAAHGKRGTIDALRRDTKVTWDGAVAAIPVGFDLSHGGLPSIFLMRGVPRMRQPDQMLYDAFYGDQTVGEIVNVQREIINKYMEEANG